jgi:hypothetical protein
MNDKTVINYNFMAKKGICDTKSKISTLIVKQQEL